MLYAKQIHKLEQCVYIVENLWLPGKGRKFSRGYLYAISSFKALLQGNWYVLKRNGKSVEMLF